MRACVFKSVQIALIGKLELLLAKTVFALARFSNSINNQQDMVIEKKEAWFSRFYKGIIFTGPYSKSHTLIEFLRITNVPSKMLIISSINQEVKAIDSELRIFNMDYYFDYH